MIALGIDPGTAICGYGFVETRGSRLRPLAYGSIFTTPDMPMEQRLMKIFDELDDLIKQHKPDVMGVEKLFFSRNVTTAITVQKVRQAFAGSSVYMHQRDTAGKARSITAIASALTMSR